MATSQQTSFSLLPKRQSNSATGISLPSWLLTVIVMMWSSFAACAEDYSSGMRAYMVGDYATAQIHWLNGAKQNDAKSMFNLGLLHHQRKLGNANPDKAEVWFDLAGKHGYASADYHLARLKAADNVEISVIRPLLLRAADNGSVPAQQWLQTLNGSSDDNLVGNSAGNEQAQIALKRNQQNALTSKNRLTATQSKPYLGEDWIASKRSTDWTIQMLAFSDQTKVQDFIDEHELHKLASYFAERSADGVLYKLIYGSYGSKQQAEQARDNLSSELKLYGPWLRSIASVQSLLNAK